MVKVHESVGDYSVLFLQKLRRLNYVTPKNYLDFVETYTKLLDEKDKYVLDQVHALIWTWAYLVLTLFFLQKNLFKTCNFWGLFDILVPNYFIFKIFKIKIIFEKFALILCVNHNKSTFSMCKSIFRLTVVLLFKHNIALSQLILLNDLKW